MERDSHAGREAGRGAERQAGEKEQGGKGKKGCQRQGKEAMKAGFPHYPAGTRAARCPLFIVGGVARSPTPTLNMKGRRKEEENGTKRAAAKKMDGEKDNKAKAKAGSSLSLDQRFQET